MNLFQLFINYIFESFKYYVQSDFFPSIFYTVLVTFVFLGLVKVLRSMK